MGKWQDISERNLEGWYQDDLDYARHNPEHVERQEQIRKEEHTYYMERRAICTDIRLMRRKVTMTQAVQMALDTVWPGLDHTTIRSRFMSMVGETFDDVAVFNTCKVGNRRFVYVDDLRDVI